MNKYKIKEKLVEDGKPVGRAFISLHVEAPNMESARRKGQVEARRWARVTHSETPKIVEVKKYTGGVRARPHKKGR